MESSTRKGIGAAESGTCQIRAAARPVQMNEAPEAESSVLLAGGL